MLETKLKNALETNKLELYYQPVVHIKTKCMVGAEALLRWNDPEKGFISPAIFIELAEKTGLILNIDNYVIDKALAQYAAWQKQGLPAFKLSINISPFHFTHMQDLKNKLKTTLQTHGLTGHFLEIEITETLHIQQIEDKIKALKELKTWGIGLAIDDFGTGYGSLTYLKYFPIDKLKIDLSFIKNLPHDIKNQAIVQAILQLAKTLNLDVVAEGVETKEELDFLEKLGCPHAQGFYFSKPLPAKAFEALLQSSSEKEKDITPHGNS